MTALVCLAFLGDGSSRTCGPHNRVVETAMAWLVARQAASGQIHARGDPFPLRTHALATQALVEAYYGGNDAALREVSSKAVAWLASQRCKDLGYGIAPGAMSGNTIATAYATTALELAAQAKLIDPAQPGQSHAFLAATLDLETGLASFAPGDRTSSKARIAGFRAFGDRPLTAACLWSLVFLRRHGASDIRSGADVLLTDALGWEPGRADPDHWYSVTYLMFQLGGRHWRQWRRRIAPLFFETQVRDGHAKGSWNPVGIHFRKGGRTYTTAMCVLCIEVYYRFARMIR